MSGLRSQFIAYSLVLLPALMPATAEEYFVSALDSDAASAPVRASVSGLAPALNSVSVANSTPTSTPIPSPAPKPAPVPSPAALIPVSRKHEKRHDWERVSVGLTESQTYEAAARTRHGFVQESRRGAVI